MAVNNLLPHGPFTIFSQLRPFPFLLFELINIVVDKPSCHSLRSAAHHILAGSWIPGVDGALEGGGGYSFESFFSMTLDAAIIVHILPWSIPDE